ncbi:T9SS type A sorting domain-containing protein [Lutibacter flavus]|uniref:Por secretion system C-terminal sorting domain-containing protein n=1 Tax=Lutibacter flavus TaxID=691689 RepID=A0A238X0Y9_9FLAO|nr:T9SS type A sorting domain-containing protein [Lutibacter flavus]SNR51549.1 Por secretion system C-terminal sorting domain-containing protein [Lutibacter flavus]
MKNLYLLLFTLFITGLSFGQDVYISEINYTGSKPGIELTGVGETDLSGWSLAFYEGTNRKVYKIIDLTERLDNSILWKDVPDISLGHPKGAGVALIDGDGNVVEFLFNYGSSAFEAKDGPAQGFENVNVGSTSGEESIQRTATGWVVAEPTPGDPSSNRSLGVVKNQIEGFNVYPNPVRDGIISITTKSSLEKYVVIYSILGSVVYQNTVRANETINVSNLNTGLYFVQVEEDDKVSVKKILIN